MKPLISINQNPNTGRKRDTEDTSHRVAFIGSFPNRHRMDDGFVSSWSRWLTYRDKQGLQVSQKALRGQIKVLANMEPDSASRAIETAIQKGWDTLFEYNDEVTQAVSRLPSTEFQAVESLSTTLKEIINSVDGKVLHESKAFQIALVVYGKWQRIVIDSPYYAQVFPTANGLLLSFWSEYVLRRNRLDYIIQHPAVAMAREDVWQEFAEMMRQIHGKPMVV